MYRRLFAAIVIGISICTVTSAADTGAALACGNKDPDASAEILFSHARRAVQREDLECARVLYAKLVLEHPHNVDFAFGYAQVLHWSGAHAEALPLLVSSRTLAPQYEDVWKLEAHVRSQMTEHGDADELTEFLNEAKTRFDNPAWAHGSKFERKPQFRWSVSATRDYLDSDAADWQRYDVLLGASLGDKAEIYLSAVSSERFERVDYQKGIGVRFDIGNSWWIDSGFAHVASPTHLSELELWLGAGHEIGNGWVGRLRIATRRYSDESLGLATIATEKYLGDFRFEYALGIASFGPETGLGHRLSVNRYFESGARLGVIAASGQEFEVIAPGQLLRVDTASAVFIAGLPFSDRLELGLHLGVHDQGDFYRRTMLGVSASGAF